MLAMSALAIGPWFQIADLNVGLLFIVGISALGIFGIVLGGWSSNSHYSLLGALRSAAQLVSYETAAGMAIVGGAAAGRNAFDARNHSRRRDDYGVWFVFAAPVGFFIYVVASIAETNRAPFDLPEAESELVAGYMTEYSGFRWALYFLAEYTNMVVVASIATTLFLGGWLRPFAGTPAFNFLDYFPSVADAGCRRVLLLSRAEAAGESAEDVHGGGGAAVHFGCGNSGRAAAGARGLDGCRARSPDCTERSGSC